MSHATLTITPTQTASGGTFILGNQAPGPLDALPSSAVNIARDGKTWLLTSGTHYNSGPFVYTCADEGPVDELVFDDTGLTAAYNGVIAGGSGNFVDGANATYATIVLTPVLTGNSPVQNFSGLWTVTIDGISSSSTQSNNTIAPFTDNHATTWTFDQSLTNAGVSRTVTATASVAGPLGYSPAVSYDLSGLTNGTAAQPTIINVDDSGWTYHGDNSIVIHCTYNGYIDGNYIGGRVGSSLANPYLLEAYNGGGFPMLAGQILDCQDYGQGNPGMVVTFDSSLGNVPAFGDDQGAFIVTVLQTGINAPTSFTLTPVVTDGAAATYAVQNFIRVSPGTRGPNGGTWAVYGTSASWNATPDLTANNFDASGLGVGLQSLDAGSTLTYTYNLMPGVGQTSAFDGNDLSQVTTGVAAASPAFVNGKLTSPFLMFV